MKTASNTKKTMWAVMSTDDEKTTMAEVIDREFDGFYKTKEDAVFAFDSDYRFNYLFEFEIKNIFTDKKVVSTDNLIKVTLK